MNIIMPKRCVFGCPYNAMVSYHQFPHPERNPEHFMAWVHIAGGKLHSQEDYELFRKKVVCDIHFTNKDKNRNNRLNFLAVPSLHLQGNDNCDPYIAPVTEVLPILNPVHNQPSTSGLTELVTDFVTPEKLLHAPESINEASKISTLKPTVTDEIHSSGKIHHEPELSTEEDKLSMLRSTVTEKCAGIIASEHNYCRVQKKAIQDKETGICHNHKVKHCQRVVPSLLLNQLKTTRSKVKNLQSKLLRSQKKNKTFESRLADAEKMTSDILLKKLTDNMTAAAKIFTGMQYSQTSKKPSGRRFSLEEKVLSLSLYKKSPRCYPLLAKLFTLPAPKSLKRLLTKVEVDSGINETIFLKMKDTVNKLRIEDRLCSLIFDEMSLSPQVHYNAAKDLLKGFTFNGQKIADHVLVFMVKGLRKKFKQPVAYYFTNSLNRTNLKEMLKKVVKHVSATGLKILCTVCDQSNVNVSVINELIHDTRVQYLKKGKEWKKEIIEIGKSKIIPLFDVPHLLKGVRNNVLTKNMKYYDFEEKCEKAVKWEYYKQVYEADKSYGELKLLQKLTDEHIYVDKIKKMKVKTAAQIFSHNVAVATEHLSARGDIPEECRNIIKFTKLMDNLFDSLNSNTFNVPNGKIYKGCVRRASPHHDLWKNAKKILKTIKFEKIIKKNNKIRLIETKEIPSIKNFIRTIEGMQHLWVLLSQTYSFDAMLTRNFNQDPLENFFGNIRSYGARNTAPDTVAFEGAFKSLLINNFNSPHSIYANCEKDSNSCLQSLDFFLRENVSNSSPSIICTSNDEETAQCQSNIDEEIVVPYINLSNSVSDAGQGNYVCGWILGKCMKNISKNCCNCKNDMFGNTDEVSNSFIKMKEYKKGKSSLLYPSKGMEKCFIQIQNIVSEIIKKEVPKKQLKQKIKMFTDIFVEFPFDCEIHKIKLRNYFENTLINVLIYSWCRSVNRILSGKITYQGDDEIKTAAQLYRNKHKCFKK